jgi:hypothetical protein
MRERPGREYRPGREERRDSADAVRRMGDYSGGRADGRSGGQAVSRSGGRVLGRITLSPDPDPERSEGSGERAETKELRELPMGRLIR